MSGVKPRGLGRRSTRLGETAPQLTPKKPSTKELLIETGERLFGRHGFDGISLREISAAAGQSGNNVVQYHFKDKEGLVAAIVEDRVRRVEVFRQSFLQNVDKNDPQYARELLKLFWLPTLMIRSAEGGYTFCRFLLQLMLQPHLAENPLAKYYGSENVVVDETVPPEAERIVKIIHLLKTHFRHLPNDIFTRRMRSLNLMFLATVVEYDNTILRQNKSGTPEFDAEPILDMAIVSLTAPA